jgi:type II secretory pathway component GspD/PulD (secretin)
MGLLNIKPENWRDSSPRENNKISSVALISKRPVVNRSFAFLSAVSLLAFTGLAMGAVVVPACAQTATTADSDVELDVTNANILSVVELLRKPGGAQFIISGDTKLFRPVTVHIVGSLPKALKYVAESAGADITKDEFGVYTISPAGTRHDSDAQQNNPSAHFAVKTNQAPSEASTHMERIALNYVNTDFVLSFFGVTQQKLSPPYGVGGVSYSGVPQIYRGDTGAIQPAMEPSKDIFPAVSISSGSGVTSVVSGVPGMSGSVGTGKNNFASSGGSTPAQQFPGGIGGAGGLDLGGQGEAGGGPGGAGGNGGVNWRPAGIDSIVGITEQNSLVVTGTAEAIALLRERIRMLDVPSKQVQVKADYVRASVSDIDNFSIDYDFAPITGLTTWWNNGTVSSSGSATTGSVGGSFSYGNVAAVMTALLQTGRAKKESSPMVTTTNNVEVQITFAETLTYTTSSTSSSTTSTTTSTQQNYITLPTTLDVTPRVNGDNSITMQYTAIFSTITSISSTGAPNYQQETFPGLRTVGNGETIVCAGMIAKTMTNTRNSIPFLCNIPIIGSMFRTRNNSVDNVEELVFLTPTVLPQPGQTLTGQEVIPDAGTLKLSSNNTVTP